MEDLCYWSHMFDCIKRIKKKKKKLFFLCMIVCVDGSSPKFICTLGKFLGEKISFL